MNITLRSLAMFLMMGTAAIAQQIDTPRPSPVGIVTQKTGLAEFTVTYSRPSAKGRKVFGDIVPFNALWRFGANMATILKSNEEFSIQGNKIPAGEYSFFAIPGETEWTLILNKTAKMSGTSNYKQEEDALRFKVKPETTPYKTETFTIGFANIRDNAAAIEVSWENTKVSFDVNVEFDAKVMKQIDDVMAGPSAGAYNTAASYYFNNNKDMKKALEYVNKALEKGGDKYWILTLKAQIQASLMDYKGAVETANKAIVLAKADEDNSYVNSNTTRIAEWTPKIPAAKGKK
jgi:tetratricopeptide (TPR) repeat protein